jgi:hypothetical protein
MSTMKSKVNAVAFGLLLGAATVTGAQTPTPPNLAAQAKSANAQRFGDQIKQYQNLSSTAAGTYTFHPAPALGSAPQDPIGHESFAQRFADSQAESSNDSNMWQETRPSFSARAADPVGNETFAQEFAQMQALSSKSGQWAFPPGANVPADEANSTLVVAKPITHPAQPPVLAAHK